MSEEKYRFVVEWFDPSMQKKRRFLLSFFPSDGGVDMYDMEARRLFLRRMKCNTVSINDLFIGSTINVLSRQLIIIDFGDKITAEKFARETESSIIIVNERGFSNLGKIISVLEKNDLAIQRGQIIDKERSGFSSSSFAENLQKRFAVFELIGPNAKKVVRKLLNPKSPIGKPLVAELSDLATHCLGPTDTKTVDAEIKIFFPSILKEVHFSTLQDSNSTCCIIKPHAVREKLAGYIMQDIIDCGFTISALEVVSFDLSAATEFYEVYKGVVEEYNDMVSHLITGSSIALEITKPSSEDVHMEFRKFVGPADPEIARKIRPGTLRAKYGQDKVKNAVHCTDLPEDTTLELDYVFRVLSL